MEECPTYYDRAAGEVRRETVLGDKWLRLAYCSPIRGLLRWPLFGCAAFSRLMGWYLDRPMSRRKIAPTVRELGIDLDEAVVPEGGFPDFNSFFARALKPGARPLPEDASRLVSPADCRLTVYPTLDGGTVVPVKGVPYTVAELFGRERAEAAEEFAGGALMVCRLCPADYHRYHFPDDGRVGDYWTLRGKYHSVNPIALARGFRVFAENLRTVSLLTLAHGRCAYLAVGAFGVASIHDFGRCGREFQRGETAGYFTFGGSTLILVFPKGVVEFDADLVEHSAQGVETLVKANEGLGRWRKPDPLCRLDVYVPASHAEALKQALFAAGAGALGNYDQCCFEIAGQGQFRPLEGAHPFAGSVGAAERADEHKLELILPAAKRAAVIAALKRAHPYETPAFQCWEVAEQ